MKENRQGIGKSRNPNGFIFFRECHSGTNILFIHEKGTQIMLKRRRKQF